MVQSSLVHLNAGYWQIELAEEDRHKSAFITKYGLYEYYRMPFGLSGASSTFQRAMHLVLRGLTWRTAHCYLDDIQKKKFLGRMVPADGVAVDPGKVAAITNWPAPINVKEVEAFLGFINYHRDHI